MSKDTIPLLCLLPDTGCGLGHIARCEAVAQHWPGQVVRNLSPIPEGAVVVIDDYRWTAQDLDFLAKKHVVVLISEFPYTTKIHIAVNPNLGASEDNYWASKKVLIGPRYYPIRKEVTSLRAGQIDVDYGAGDVFEVAGANRQMPTLDFAKQMRGAKIVVTPASVSAYEAMCLGRAVLLMYPRVENQKKQYDALLKSVALPDSPIIRRALLDGAITPTIRDLQSAGMTMVDGQGAQRIVDAALEAWRCQ